MNNSEIVDKVFDRHRIDLKNPKFDISIVIEMIHDAIKMFDEQPSSEDKEIEWFEAGKKTEQTITLAAIEKLKIAEKEIERLKGLIEKAYKVGQNGIMNYINF